jgi:multicomponent K+:H+ antiporter subunit A
VLPVLGEVGLASAALFDLGVYATVVGATLLLFSTLGAASKEAPR